MSASGAATPPRQPRSDRPTRSGPATDAVRSPTVPSPAVRALTLLALLVCVAHLLRSGIQLVDDALISLRYARHLVEGHGLVFNLGERVEGYTNFLWVLAGAAVLKLGLPAPGALQALSAAAAVATAALVHREARRLRLPASVPGPLVWLLPLPAFAYWGTTAMETMAVAALATAGFLLAAAETRDGRRRGSLAAFVLLGLTRPDGPLLFALSHLGLALAGRRTFGRADLRRRAGDAALFALLWGAWFVGRWAWYGEMLPNTFHAKVTGGREQLLGGWAAVSGWALHHPLWTALLLAAPLGGWRATAPAAGSDRASRREAGLLLLAGSLVAWGQVLYVLAIGGDFMPWWRFLLPITPLLTLLVPLVLAEALGGRRTPGRGPVPGRPLPAAAAVALFLVHAITPRTGEEELRAFVADRTTVVGLEVGAHLRRELPRDALVALNTAGAVPWASGLPTLDMLGLTDAAIARHPVVVVSPRWAGHRRGWGDSVLARRPEAILWYNSAGLATPHYLGDRQLAESARFRFFYQLRRDVLATRPAAGTHLGTYLGVPLGEGRSPELGLDATVPAARPRRTVVLAAPITVHWFRFRRDLAPLWPVWDRAADLDDFLDRAVRLWSIAPRPPVDPAARRRVDELSARALAAIEAGRTEDARPLLEEAVALARAAGSPVPFQYVGNLAVLEGNPPLAVQAWLEALRLAPRNPLYRRNLRFVLDAPWEELARPAQPSGSSGGAVSTR